MEAIEQTYCRAPLARAFNRVSCGLWVSNINISFSKKFGRDKAFSGSYESGLPDGFGIRLGRIVCVECKAAFGKFLKSEWSDNQRGWYLHKCVPTRTPYYVAVFLGADRNKRDGNIYLVPGADMISGVYKSVSVESAHTLWSCYKLKCVGGNYVIPESLWSK